MFTVPVKVPHKQWVFSKYLLLSTISKFWGAWFISSMSIKLLNEKDHTRSHNYIKTQQWDILAHVF